MSHEEAWLQIVYQPPMYARDPLFLKSETVRKKKMSVSEIPIEKAKTISLL